jgi:UDP-N-acetylglucosamine--N-acetylmuramyl-(pentapeptide) pyrophosphoryl-undecaprenol N-acetylglucosamine transferase
MKQLVCVSSAGGHLEQLRVLLPSLVRTLDSDVVHWVTSPGPQLDGLQSVADYIHERPTVDTRDLAGAVREMPQATLLLRRLRRSGEVSVVSTGAAIALPYLTSARALRLRAVYVESATRTRRASLTARLLRMVSGVERYGQWPALSEQGLPIFANVFEIAGREVARRQAWDEKNVLVLTGTKRDMPFNRLRDASLALAGARSDLTVGLTPMSQPSNWRAVDALSYTEVSRRIKAGHQVIAHAGIGSILTVQSNGGRPIIVPRSRRLGEHIDDHQVDIARALATTEVVSVVPEPSVESLTRALEAGLTR